MTPGVQGLRVVADRVQQVRLAETRAAVDEQRVVGLRGRLRHGDGGRVGEPVGLADHEVVEGVLRVEPRLVADRRRLLLDGGDSTRAGSCRADAKSATGDGHRLLLHHVVVHGDAEGGDLVADPGERLHDRESEALVDLSGGEIVGNLEVERRGHHAGGGPRG